MVIAVCQGLGVLVLLVMAVRLGGMAGSVGGKIETSLEALQQAVGNLNGLLADLRDRGVIGKAAAALDSASGAANRIDPLAAELSTTMQGVRELLDDATQTSQSLRARVDDLAAMQSELTAMTRALTDVSCELRDKELAGKIANVLSDTSLLAADIGILTENANSYLERGKPLVSNIETVVSSAKQRATGISGTLGSIKEGLKAGAEAWREHGKDEGGE
jgi:ABC-type transporter Mla subunit MlaD